MHIYKVRPRKDKRGVDLVGDVLPFGRLCYGGPNAASKAVWWANRARGKRIRSNYSALKKPEEFGTILVRGPFYVATITERQ